MAEVPTGRTTGGDKVRRCYHDAGKVLYSESREGGEALGT